MSKPFPTRKNKRRNRRNAPNQSLVPAPRRALIPSQRPRIERAIFRFSGASVTNATSAGYSWISITSDLFSNASPWTALSNLYMFVRPLYARVTVTSNRSTGSSDNPVVGFVATPDGAAVGTTAMNISTFEAPNVMTRTLGPGVEVSYSFQPYIAITAYSTAVASGYVPMKCPRVSLNTMPKIYFGDLLLLTPGVVLTSSAHYIQGKIEFVYAFDTLDNANIQ